MKNKALLLFFPVFAASLTSCVQMSQVPYAITEPECRIGKIQELQEFAGIYVTFYNNSEKSVKDITFSCLVFDSNGDESPFVGSNVISSRSSGIIKPKSTQEINISLDKYITQIPLEPYIIDFFYIKKIEYEDGSVWTDPYGSWMQGGL